MQCWGRHWIPPPARQDTLNRFPWQLNSNDYTPGFCFDDQRRMLPSLGGPTLPHPHPTHDKSQSPSLIRTSLASHWGSNTQQCNLTRRATLSLSFGSSFAPSPIQPAYALPLWSTHVTIASCSLAGTTKASVQSVLFTHINISKAAFLWFRTEPLSLASMGNTTFGFITFFPLLFHGTCKAEISSFWDLALGPSAACIILISLPLWPAARLQFPPLWHTHAVSALTQRTRLWHVSTARNWLEVLNLTWLYSHRNPGNTGRV